jgi:hypothetical protein
LDQAYKIYPWTRTGFLKAFDDFRAGLGLFFTNIFWACRKYKYTVPIHAVHQTIFVVYIHKLTILINSILLYPSGLYAINTGYPI